MLKKFRVCRPFDEKEEEEEEEEKQRNVCTHMYVFKKFRQMMKKNFLMAPR